MQKKELTPITPVALSGRTIHEITADIFVNFRNAKASIAQIGRDLNEAKQLLNHGDWLPYLEGLRISVSTAENYMRYAAAVPEDERLAALPYSAAIALLALPDDQRQRVQENDLDGKSAAEIKRLIAEVKKEKQRADDTQKALDMTTADLKKSIRELEERPVVKETVAPDDYDRVKETNVKLREQLAEAIDAAADAEERANAAVAASQRLSMQQIDEDDESSDDSKLSLSEFAEVCSDFQAKVWSVPFMGDVFVTLTEPELNSYRLYVNGVKSWAERVLAAMDSTKGVIYVDAEQ